MTLIQTAGTTRQTQVLTVLGAIAQLAAMGAVGAFVAGGLIIALSLGFGLLLLAGIGILFLIFSIYYLFVVAWLDAARIEGLYAFDVEPVRAQRSGRPGFGGLVATIWQQFTDARMWRALVNAAIDIVLGVLTLGLMSGIGWSIGLIFAGTAAPGDVVPLGRFSVEIPLYWNIPLGLLFIVLIVVALLGLGLAHGIIARSLHSPSREAELMATAELSTQQRDGALRASELERGRIERDLHDGVQPRLVSIGMTLGLAQQKLATDPSAASELITEAHTSTKAAITELRQLARGIHASVLQDRGLDAALSAIAARSQVPVELNVDLPGRCSSTAETAIYFAVAEALTNAAKHARASSISVTVTLREATIWATIVDNGIGGAVVTPGGGLDGIINRVTAVQGSANLISPPGGPTVIEVQVPCAS